MNTPKQTIITPPIKAALTIAAAAIQGAMTDPMNVCWREGAVKDTGGPIPPPTRLGYRIIALAARVARGDRKV